MRNIIKSLLAVTILQLALSTLSYTRQGISNEGAWEYKIVSDYKDKETIYDSSDPNRFIISDSVLTSMGEEGWELVDTYTILETVHPNFGNSSYVTGLQPNVRTKELVFIYKRRKS
jgi:hypothetical protein